MENEIFKQYPDLEPVTKILIETLKPIHILLFGTTVGGTQHSEPHTYDILVITPETPRYDHSDLKRYLKQRLPNHFRTLAATNIYIHSQNFNPCTPSPYLYFARHEGRLLYCADSQQFIPQKASFNYAEAYRNCSKYYNTFFEMGVSLLKDARRYYEEGNLRMTAFCTSHAVLLFFRVHYYVYHGFATECDDPLLLRRRMRTLSFDLNLIFDSEDNNGRLASLYKTLRNESLDLLNTYFDRKDVEWCLISGEKIEKVIKRISNERLELYKKRIN